MPRVVRLNVAPVKSLGLQHPDELWLGETGAPGDRRFFLVDETGRMVRGAYHGPLVRVRPDVDGDTLALAFPDGTIASARIAQGEPIVASFFGKRPVAGRVLEGPWAEALTRYANRPLRIVEADEPGAGTDSAIPVSIVSRESVRELSRRGGADRELDARRFRMHVEIDGVRAHEEDEWEGRLVRAGDAVLRVAGPIGRCANTTYDPDTGERDFDTLRAIKDYRGQDEEGEICFGVYAAVEQPGRVRLGDEVEPL
jgi:uncharacterized protein YcbX